MPNRLCSATTFRPLLTASSRSVTSFLNTGEVNTVRRVCRMWQCWIDEARAVAPDVTLRVLSATEIDDLINALQRLNLPWSTLTDAYVREVLLKTPAIHSPDELPTLAILITRLYQRAVLAPATNIGTLDTTRVIERLTQARLSRFHSTGAASIQQASNLENLLHPQQSTKRPQMTLALFLYWVGGRTTMPRRGCVTWTNTAWISIQHLPCSTTSVGNYCTPH